MGQRAPALIRETGALNFSARRTIYEAIAVPLASLFGVPSTPLCYWPERCLEISRGFALEASLGFHQKLPDGQIAL